MFPQGEREERNQREGGKEVKEVEREGERRKESAREADSALHSVFQKFQINIRSDGHCLLCVVFRVRSLELWGPISHPLPGVYPETIHSTNSRMEGLTSQPPSPSSQGPAARVASQFPEPRGAAMKTIHLGTQGTSGALPRAFAASFLMAGRWCFVISVSEVRPQVLRGHRAKVAQDTKQLLPQSRVVADLVRSTGRDERTHASLPIYRSSL